MDDILFDEMFRVEGIHWWFQAKHKIVEALLRRYVRREGSARPRVADLGCGCGMMLAKLQADYDCVGLDGFQRAVDFCAKRGIHVEKGGLPEPIPFDSRTFDAVLLLDVLEHLDDDAGTINNVRRLLKPGGVIIATSPAYQWLWTARDDHHHHRRRYTRRSFARLFEHPDLKVTTSSYLNTLLFPLAAAERLARQVVPAKEGIGDLKIPPRPINGLMRETFASERWLLGRVRLPFGLSVICVAQKLDD